MMELQVVSFERVAVLGTWGKPRVNDVNRDSPTKHASLGTYKVELPTW